jgi:formiminoglutamase
MKNYSKAKAAPWGGRHSGKGLYLHEKVQLVDLLDPKIETQGKTIALLGYACDAGVARNQGRPGADLGPEAVRKMLGRMPNHLEPEVSLWDTGDVSCPDGNMESTQHDLRDAINMLLKRGTLPVVMGGGHDMAYGHFKGIEEYKGPQTRIGIINFDAHFDLRSNEQGNNSGTPFFQIAKELKQLGRSMDYLCLGIRADGNDTTLYTTAESLGVHFIEREDFSIQEVTTVQMGLLGFMDGVDGVYVSIDLDGFSSAYAPGVSSPSPMGFSPDIVWEALKIIIDSGKLYSLDVAELNPKFDIDGHTARLAASLLHGIIHRWALL